MLFATPARYRWVFNSLPNAEQMEAFCDDLRGERERRQIALATVSEVTKVPQRHLLALEEGRFADLPGGIFRKGILRGYLQALGVDPAPWMPRFEVCLAALEVVAEPVVALEEIAAGVERSRIAEPPRTESSWSGVMVLLMLLLAFGWCVWRFALRGHVVLSQAAPAGVHNTAEKGSREMPLRFRLRPAAPVELLK